MGPGLAGRIALMSSYQKPLNGVKFGCFGPQNIVKFICWQPQNEVKYGCWGPPNGANFLGLLKVKQYFFNIFPQIPTTTGPMV